MATVGPGNLTTVTFGTSAFAMVITSIDSYTLSRESIDFSNMATTTNLDFLPSDLSDLGELTVSGHFAGNLTPPIGTDDETITVNWAGDGSSWAELGFMTSFTAGAPMNDMMTGQYTIKFSGATTPG